VTLSIERALTEGGIQRNRSRLYVVADSLMNVSKSWKGDATGIYIAGMCLTASDGNNRLARAPAYKCKSTVPTSGTQ
jgi:hypothetical protein